MSLANLAALGSFISGVAVLASLIFVGFQLRQNTQAIRATASQAHSHNWLQITLPVMENAEFARIWKLGTEDVDRLSDEERIRFYAFAGAALRFFEGARLQWRHGQLDREHWHNVERTATDFAATSGFRAYWAARRHWLSPDFQKWYETILPENAHLLYGKPASQTTTAKSDVRTPALAD